MINKSKIINIFTISIILLLSAATLNLALADQNLQDDTNLYFIEAPNHENTGIRFSKKIPDGNFYMKEDGTMVYRIANEKGQILLEEKFLETDGLNLTGIDKNKDGYRSLNLGEIYKNTEVSLKADAGNIEKLITVKPQGDPDQLRILLSGANNIAIAETGGMLIKTGIGTLKMSAPLAFQEINGQKNVIEIEYNLIDKSTYGFKVGTYDNNYPLIIDPILYSTFLGGDINEEFTSGMNTSDDNMVIAVDPFDGLEYVYVTGYTEADGDFPTSNYLPAGDPALRGFYDVFVVKMPLDLSEITAAVLIGGDGDDMHASITADAGGDIYVGFQTTSTNLPTTVYSYQQNLSGGQDIGIIKLNAALDTVLAATYLGGSNNELPGNLFVSNNRVHITGTTENLGGNDFPAGPTSGTDQVYNFTPGSTGSEIFISRLDDNLSGTEYIGSYIHDGTGDPFITVYSVDSNPDNDKVIVTGRTVDGLEIVTPSYAYQPSYGGGTNDNFVARLNSRLTTLEASTYIGGGSFSNGNGSVATYEITPGDYRIIIAHDAAEGNTFFESLRTDGSNEKYDYDTNPYSGMINNCADDDLYIANFNNTLSQAYVAVICGDAFDYHPRAVVDSSGDIYLSASSNSTNYPVTNDSYQQAQSGFYDIVISKLSNTLDNLYSSTYLGGTEASDLYGVGLEFDQFDNFYLAGQTFSPDFPTSPFSYQPLKEGYDSDYFVTGMTNDLSSPCSPLLNNEDTDGFGSISAVSEACLGLKIRPGTAYIEYVPQSFTFPVKFSTSVEQNSFSNDNPVTSEIDVEPAWEDVLTVRDLRGTGNFQVTIQADTFSSGTDSIPASNMYLATTAPDTGDLDALDTTLNGTTSTDQITYAEGSVGQDISSGTDTNQDLNFPSTYINDGQAFGPSPILLMNAPTSSHYLRASQSLNFYLNIPASQPAGIYSTVFTLDLILG